MAQITHGKVKRGGSSLMMLILPLEGEGQSPGGGFRLEPFKGIKRERKGGGKRETVGVVCCVYFPFPEMLLN